MTFIKEAEAIVREAIRRVTERLGEDMELEARVFDAEVLALSELVNHPSTEGMSLKEQRQLNRDILEVFAILYPLGC